MKVAMILAGHGRRYTNIQLINTIGVAEEDKREGLECWCKDKKDHGSFFCCKDCPAKDGPAVDYRLEYTVTYRCCQSAQTQGHIFVLPITLLKRLCSFEHVRDTYAAQASCCGGQ